MGSCGGIKRGERRKREPGEMLIFILPSSSVRYLEKKIEEMRGKERRRKESKMLIEKK